MEQGTLTSPGTPLIDAADAEEYMDNVRTYLPRGMEDQMYWAGVREIVSGYVAYCYMTDVDPKECGETIVRKIGATNKLVN